jgi:hypothetical protein
VRESANDPPPDERRLPLTSREAVLNNIEYAYDHRDIDVIDELLDAEFTFFFAPGDVGGQIPEQWPRTDELQVTNDLFVSNSQPVPTGPVCRSVRVDVGTNDLHWVPITPDGYPNETWYTTITFYSFIFEMELDQTFVSSPGAKAEFIVRNVGSVAVPHWRLVEWRDSGANFLVSARTVGGTSEKAWGSIKALYR